MALLQALDVGFELGGAAPLSFATLYPHLLDRPLLQAGGDSRSALIIRRRFKAWVKSGILLLGLLLAVAAGLAVGLTTGNAGWVLGTIGAAATIIGVLVTAYWTRSAPPDAH